MGGISETLQITRRWCGGIMYVATLYFSSLSGFIVLSPIYVSAFLLGLPAAQWILDTLLSLWMAFAVGTYELFYGVKIVIQGDVRKLNKNRCSLILMNHRTRIDWLFFFSVQIRYGSLRRFKIALKDEIRHVPGAGWTMQAAQFLFLKRKWEVDRNRVDSTLKLCQRNCISPQLLFFPEGTDFQGYSRQKSKDYAERNDLEDYNYVLHPRTLGFTSVVSFMKAYNNLDQIVDVTVSYPRTLLQNEYDLINGNIPREVVFTIKCYEVDELPTDNEPLLIRWLEDRWREKEAFLKCFYANKEYTESTGYTREQSIEIERDTKVHVIIGILFWTLLCVFTINGLLYSYTFCVIYFLACAICIVLSTFIGFDKILNNISLI